MLPMLPCEPGSQHAFARTCESVLLHTNAVNVLEGSFDLIEKGNLDYFWLVCVSWSILWFNCGGLNLAWDRATSYVYRGIHQLDGV